MNWLFGKQKQAQIAKPQPSIESIRRKLAGYQPTAGRSKFEGPSLMETAGIFEFEKVSIDPESTGMHQAIPFSC